MTLRTRLVVALGVLLALGLGVFGASTYTAYRRTQYQRLDDQLRSASGFVTRSLLVDAGLDSGPTGGGGPGAGRGLFVPPGWYAELRDAGGNKLTDSLTAALANGATSGSTPVVLDEKAVPELGSLPTGPGVVIFTRSSVSGGTDWRVEVSQPRDAGTGTVAIVAAPMSEVSNSLNRLALIELLAGVSLIVALLIGSWFILRRGLRPLETMAGQAREISAGDLSQRVEPADGRGEVGQLGQAINTMLGEIESAFAERAATEHKLRQFLADASHELRTPLTSIQGFAELFRMGAANDHLSQDTMVRRIEEESARMRRLVEDLLLLARLDQTRPVQRAAVDLTVLCADACTDAVAMAPDRGVSLDAPEPIVVSGDRDHLRQALANLITNAIRHTPAGSPIEVSARLESGIGIVRVRDHGTGLDDEALTHVFDRFWQADRSRAGSGVGLGLSIVAAIAAEHGGTATVRNHPDGGAEFTVTVPVDPSQ